MPTNMIPKNAIKYYPNYQKITVKFELYKDNNMPPIDITLKTITNDNKISATLRYIADTISDLE